MEAGYRHPSHPQPKLDLKPRILVLLAALAALGASLPAWVAPSQAAVRAGQGMVGVGGVMEKLAAAGWSAGGLAGATAVQGLMALACWIVAVGALLFVCGLVISRRPRWSRVVSFVAGLALLLIAGRGVGTAFKSADEVRDVRLLAPMALVEKARTATDGPIFSNPSAAGALALVERSEAKRYSLKESAKATASTLAWRELNRSRPPGAVILGGSLAETRGLQALLAESPEWHLAAVDATGLLFLRGSGAAFAPSETTGIDGGPLALARTAVNLDFAGFRPAARTLMAEALNRAPDSASVLTEAASLAASQGRWEKGRSYAERALEKRPDSVPARYFLALALLETNVADKAAEEASRLVAASPNDPSILLLHARCARRANDFEAETNSLERLLKILPPAAQGRIQIYLGQAWAKRGFAERSLAAYEAALKAELTPDERAQVQEAVGVIRSKRPPGN